jgi:hypothetical protein
MADRPRRALFPNPFYVILLVASTVFTVTVLMYLVSPYAAERPNAGAGSIALVDWLDRRGPMALGVEFAMMLVSGILAMVTDRWFSPKPSARKNPTTGSPLGGNVP